MAGFQVTIIGRFWVTAEASANERRDAVLAPVGHNAGANLSATLQDSENYRLSAILSGTLLKTLLARTVHVAGLPADVGFINLNLAGQVAAPSDRLAEPVGCAAA